MPIEFSRKFSAGMHPLIIAGPNGIRLFRDISLAAGGGYDPRRPLELDRLESPFPPDTLRDAITESLDVAFYLRSSYEDTEEARTRQLGASASVRAYGGYAGVKAELTVSRDFKREATEAGRKISWWMVIWQEKGSEEIENANVFEAEHLSDTARDVSFVGRYGTSFISKVYRARFAAVRVQFSSSKRLQSQEIQRAISGSISYLSNGAEGEAGDKEAATSSFSNLKVEVAVDSFGFDGSAFVDLARLRSPTELEAKLDGVCQAMRAADSDPESSRCVFR